MPAKTFNSRHARLMAQCTNTAREVSASEARRRDLIARARRIARLETQARKLKRDLAAARLALRVERRELKAVSQVSETFEFSPFDRRTGGGE